MKILKKISINLLILILLLIPIFTYAQNPIPPSSSSQTTSLKIPNPLKDKTGTLMSLLGSVLDNIVMPIAAVAVVMWIIWAGFQYVLAQGKPAEIEKAHQRLLWSLVGGGILLGAAAIAKVVQTTIETLVN